MKRFFVVLLTTIMLLSTFVLFSCGKENNDADNANATRMTIDINPSVELMLDTENKVVSVTALNDDGAILIAGEAIVGKSAEEATEIIIQLASDTGYLVDGEENEVKISLSGDADALEAEIKNKINAKLDELDIEGKVTALEAMKLEELRALVLESSTYTEAEVNEMSEGELYDALALSRVESALLLTEDLRNAYFSAKEYDISFAEREETAKIIDEMGTLYEVLNTGYKTLLKAYSEALIAIENYRYDNLIDPECEYQMLLTRMRDAKIELVQKKNELAEMSKDSDEYATELESLEKLEANYQASIEAYESIGQMVNSYIDGLLTELKAIEAELIKLENEFSDDIKSELESKASELEAKMNEYKDSYFEKFEAEHSADIEAIENELLAKKQALIESKNSDKAE
ncbi:MAG: hypothetical protein IJD89_01355 [Clostridia bacterium]|nr:hypothetical protein [Clostridia bacterium]